MPDKLLINSTDIKNLINGYSFLSNNLKNTLNKTIEYEIENNEAGKGKTIRNIYNIYAIIGKFNSEALFRNGRIIFKDDNELIYDIIAGPNNRHTEQCLFDGCVIAKDSSCSYIIISNIEGPDIINKVSKSFNFKKLVQNAITPPEITITLNVGYYPSFIESILQVIK